MPQMNKYLACETSGYSKRLEQCLACGARWIHECLAQEWTQVPSQIQYKELPICWSLLLGQAKYFADCSSPIARHNGGAYAWVATSFVKNFYVYQVQSFMEWATTEKESQRKVTEQQYSPRLLKYSIRASEFLSSSRNKGNNKDIELDPKKCQCQKLKQRHQCASCCTRTCGKLQRIGT